MLVSTGPSLPRKFKDIKDANFATFVDHSLEKQYPDVELGPLSKNTKFKMFFDKWPGRSIDHFDSKIIGGEVVRKQWKVRWPILKDGKFNDKKGIIKPECYDALLIKPSETAKLVYITPFPVGCAPQKVYNQDSRFYEWLADGSTDKKFKDVYDPLKHDRVYVTGSWESQHDDIQRWCSPITNELKYKDYKEAIRVRFDGNVKLPIVDAPTRDSIMSVATNPKAQVGLVSGKLFGNNHRNADRALKPVVQKLWDKVSKQRCIDRSIWSLGGRERLQKLHTDGPLRSRPVIMPDGILKIFGLNYSQRVFDALSQINFDDFFNEIRLGSSEHHGNCFKESEFWERFINCFEADVSNHDGGTTERTLVVAFGVIRSLFPDGEEIDNHFYYMMSGEVFKNFCVPGRFVYRVLKGLCTGSAFTSLLVSICNWLNWSAVFVKEDMKPEEIKLWVYGDDTKIGLPIDFPFDADYVSSKFERLTGHKLGNSAIRSQYDDDVSIRPTFLKSVYNNGLHCRNISDVLLSLSYTRKKNKPWLNAIEMVSAQMYLKPYYPGVFDMLSSYRKWLTKKFREESILRGRIDVAEQYISSILTGKRDRFNWNRTSILYLKPIVFGYERPALAPYARYKKKISSADSVLVPEFMSDDFLDTLAIKRKRKYLKKVRAP